MLKALPAAMSAFDAVGPLLTELKAAGDAFKTKGKGKGKKRKKPVGKRPSTTGKYIPQGDSAGTRKLKVSKKRKPKGKPSLKKQVAKLKKQMVRLPPNTREKFRQLTNIALQTLNPNEKRVFLLRVMDHQLYETAIANIDGVDLTAKNTSVRILNRFAQFRLKNFGNNNAVMKYQFLRVADDDGESYLTNILEEAADRGLTIAGLDNASSAASATANFIPRRMAIKMDEPEGFAQVFGVHGNKFTRMGPVEKVRLGPGDVLNINKKFGMTTYRPEKLDQEPFDNLTGDIVCVIECLGDFQTNPPSDGTAPNLISFGEVFVGGTMFQTFDAVVQNGLGLKLNEAYNTFDRTNVSASAVVMTNQDPTPDITLAG